MIKTNGFAKNNYEELRKELLKIHNENNSYGYRRLTAEIRNRGYKVNHKLISRLMAEEKITSTRPNKKRSEEESTNTFNTYIPGFGKPGKDLLQRNFTAEHFGEKWGIDISEISFGKEKCIYLTILIDLYNSEITGYSISEKPDLTAIMEALLNAYKRHKHVKPIIHSDRGWFFCTDGYIRFLNSYGYTRSMTSTGSCYDNAVAESFFAQIKSELIYPTTWSTLDELKKSIHRWIYYYNHTRIKKKLGYLSPVDYRLQNS